MKILYLVPRYYPAVGGSENLIKSFAEDMVKKGHEVTVYTTNVLNAVGLWGSDKDQQVNERDFEEINGVKVYRFKIKNEWFFGSFLVSRIIRKIMQFIPIWQIQCLRGNTFCPDLYSKAKKDTEKFDVVHVTPIPYDFLFYCAYLFAKKSNAKLVCTPAIHIGESKNSDYSKDYTKPYTLKLLEKFNLILTNTNIETNFLKEKLKNSNIHTLGIGINPADFPVLDPTEFRKEYKIPNDAFVIYSIATKTKDKGTNDLVLAFQKLKKEFSNAYLVLGGNELEDFKDFFKDQDKERIIYFEGSISNETYDNVASTGDVFVMASRTDSFGIAYLEAWVRKKPVVGANAGGVAEVISDNEDGYLVEFGNAEEIYEKLKTLLQDEKLRTKLGESGFTKVMEKYNKEKILKTLHEFYFSK